MNKENENAEAPIKLLWTGGFDSTFRLLQLVLLKRKQVQPYYIIDHERKSTGYELKAMEAVKEDLFKKHPQTKPLLLPTRISHRNEIQPSSEITRHWKELKINYQLGRQYEWLACFAEQNGLDDLETCWEKKTTISEFFKRFYSDLTGEGNDCRLKDDFKNESFCILKNFRFPTVYTTKVEMEQLAKENGFFDLLGKTWFCHTPKKNGKPCEICLPCRMARKSGYSHGLPKTNILRDKWLRVGFNASRVWARMVEKSRRGFWKIIQRVQSLYTNPC